MPEPFSIAFAAIGTSLSVLGIVSSLLSTINDRITSIADFSSRLSTLVGRLEGCQKAIGEWDALWSYGLNPADSELNSKLWKSRAEFKEIRKKRKLVDSMAEKVESYVNTSFNIGGTRWGDLDPSELSRRATLFVLVKSIRFAFFSEKTLRDKVGYVEDAIDNLERSSKSRQTELAGNNAPASVTEQTLARLIEIEIFGESVWKLRDDPKSTISEWTLELRPLGWAGCTNILNWQVLDTVHIWISFRIPRDTALGNDTMPRIVGLDYSLGNGPPRPKAWADALAVNWLPPHLQGNPKITHHNMPRQRTKSFRDLFASDNFFAQVPVYELWKTDLSHLLVSLTNWSGLLWNTNWTSNLCTSGIRFVPTVRPGPSVHTLCSQQDHAPNKTTPQTCGHGRPEQQLRNLGLVLAELICANPFRLAGGGDRYQKWDGGSQSWIDVSTDDVLGNVQQKTGFIDVREAVQFCLEATNVRVNTDGHAAFLHQYTTQIVKPMKAWADCVQDPKNKLPPPPSGFRRWPQDAFDNMVNLAVVNPVMANPTPPDMDTGTRQTPAMAVPAENTTKRIPVNTTSNDIYGNRNDKPGQQEDLSNQPFAQPIKSDIVTRSGKPIDQILIGNPSEAGKTIDDILRSEKVASGEMAPQSVSVVEEASATKNGSHGGQGRALNGGIPATLAGSDLHVAGEGSTSASPRMQHIRKKEHVPGAWDDSW